MASRSENLAHRLAAAAAAVEPRPLLEWHVLSRAQGRVAMPSSFPPVNGVPLLGDRVGERQAPTEVSDGRLTGQ